MRKHNRSVAIVLVGVLMLSSTQPAIAGPFTAATPLAPQVLAARLANTTIVPKDDGLIVAWAEPPVKPDQVLMTLCYLPQKGIKSDAYTGLLRPQDRQLLADLEARLREHPKQVEPPMVNDPGYTGGGGGWRGDQYVAFGCIGVSLALRFVVAGVYGVALAAWCAGWNLGRMLAEYGPQQSPYVTYVSLTEYYEGWNYVATNFGIGPGDVLNAMSAVLANPNW